jgi:glyoxylase-like metal-dependent hydrolase (beta-lactamase superfamily II)
MTTKNDHVYELIPGLAVHSLIGENSSHLVVRNGRSLLIDCHSGQCDRWLERRGLPRPEKILHTQVQPEHCREAGQFPEAAILVHEKLVELASDPEAYARKANTVWDHPEEWMITLGQEAYGVAGSTTVFPPDQPLKVGGVFREGDRIEWQDLVFEVVAVPGHGRHPVAFVLEQGGVPLALFTGDLLRDPARLVNFYDLEINYGGTVIKDLPAALRALAARPVTRWFPATGPVIEDGPAQAKTLAKDIEAYQQSLEWRSGKFKPSPHPDYPKFGRYIRLHKGIYQITGAGNCILLIDKEGRGLMFDPGPCDYETPGREGRFVDDLVLLERECGLKTIDLALITHFHGDHYDMAPALKKRYPGCRVGAWDLVARVCEAPWDYPYPAELPWYNLGFDHVPMDVVLNEKEPFFWHDTAIRSIHLPGHCYCHAAYLLSFNGLRLAITGDTLQSWGDSVSLGFTTSNHSVPDERSGFLKTFRSLCAETVDLNLGGHGSHFRECSALYAESLERNEHVQPFLRRLIGGDSWEAAFLRPSFPRWPTWECRGAGHNNPA